MRLQRLVPLDALYIQIPGQHADVERQRARNLQDRIQIHVVRRTHSDSGIWPLGVKPHLHPARGIAMGLLGGIAQSYALKVWALDNPEIPCPKMNPQASVTREYPSRRVTGDFVSRPQRRRQNGHCGHRQSQPNYASVHHKPPEAICRSLP